ncbi:MAG: DUF2752 domain-containing protein [Thermoanaerobaculia bacterium]
MHVWDPSRAGGPDLCLFHRLTGTACPACGLTRAAAALAKWRFAESWRWNPMLAPMAVAALVLWLLWGAVGESSLARRVLAQRATRTALAAGLLLVLVWLLRLTLGTLPA